MPITIEQLKRRLAKNLRTHRVTRGLSPGELAARADVPVVTILRAEDGDGNIDIRRMVRLAKALQVEAASLLAAVPR